MVVSEETGLRVNLKWAFGILSVLLVLVSLVIAGLYRASGQGATKEIVIPMIENACLIRDEVKDTYQSLLSKAKKYKGGDVTIPNIGIELEIPASEITKLDSEELADKVILEVQRSIYRNGYLGKLPMARAYGIGEERGKAMCETILALLNRHTHANLILPLAITGGLAFLFFLLCLIFSRGWGKVTSAGLILLLGALSGSLLLRAACEFLWKPGQSGVFKGAMNEALSASSVIALPFFDLTLAAGAVFLLVGVIGSIASKRSRNRIPPFLELEQHPFVPFEEATRTPSPLQAQPEEKGHSDVTDANNTETKETPELNPKKE